MYRIFRAKDSIDVENIEDTSSEVDDEILGDEFDEGYDPI